MKSRSRAREGALVVLYELAFGDRDIDEVTNRMLEDHDLEPDLAEYAKQVINGVAELRVGIDQNLAGYLKGYDYQRLAAVDRTILRIAAYEILHMPELAPAISINEAIELARKYSTAESGKFINGVLGRLLRDTPKANWQRNRSTEEPPSAPEPEPQVEVINEDAPEAEEARKFGKWTLGADPMTPELLCDVPCHTGEGPTWHAQEQVLYWTDIPAGTLYRYDPASTALESFEIGRPVGGMTVQEDGRLLLFMDNGAIAMWDRSQLEFVQESMPEEQGNRFNDVIAAPDGSVFCGTMSNANTPGRLYRLMPNGQIVKLLEGTKTSNGMGFSPDLSTFYFTDSGPATIYEFDFDKTSGAIFNQGVLIQVDRSVEGATDGMTVDSEGFIWSARWDGSRLVRHSPDGTEVLRIDFPTRKVSCCLFGGPDYRDLYVTTAGGHEREANGPLAGSLFRVRPEVGGRAEFLSKIKL